MISPNITRAIGHGFEVGTILGTGPKLPLFFEVVGAVGNVLLLEQLKGESKPDTLFSERVVPVIGSNIGEREVKLVSYTIDGPQVEFYPHILTEVDPQAGYLRPIV